MVCYFRIVLTKVITVASVTLLIAILLVGCSSSSDDVSESTSPTGDLFSVSGIVSTQSTVSSRVVEGLFAEVLRDPGLMNRLRNKYKITVTGPTTLSALLNSLQMGFRTLLVQKRSSEVWKILSAVKSEFDKFGEQLEKVDKQLTTASKSLGDLRNTRTKAMTRKMRDIEILDKTEPEDILQISDEEELTHAEEVDVEESTIE